MAFIDGTVVNVALPALQTDLHATVAQRAVGGRGLHAVPGRADPAGRVAGRPFGRRRIYGIGRGALRPRLDLVRTGAEYRPAHRRAGVQGIGGALLVPGSLAIIGASFRRDAARGRAIGTWSAFASITTAVGPVLGGLLVDACFVAGGLLHQRAAWP